MTALYFHNQSHTQQYWKFEFIEVTHSSVLLQLLLVGVRKRPVPQEMKPSLIYDCVRLRNFSWMPAKRRIRLYPASAALQFSPI